MYSTRKTYDLFTDCVFACLVKSKLFAIDRIKKLRGTPSEVSYELERTKRLLLYWRSI